MIAYTFNMQGANGDGENRWSSDVPYLFSTTMAGGGASIVFLQECGRPPAIFEGARRLTRRDFPRGTFLSDAVEYRCVAWPAHRGGRTLTIFHALWGEGNSRCSLAVVTSLPIEALFAAGNPLGETLRPTIGVKTGSKLYCTLHALSGSGNDGPRIVDGVAAFSAGVGARDWFLGGDFNRDPGMYSPQPIGRFTWDSGYATRPTSRTELDYAIASFAPASRPTPMQSPQSDHLPVRFELPN